MTTVNFFKPALMALMVSAAFAASAAPVTVLPGDPSWSTLAGDNSGGGSSTITATAPRSGNGSLEMFGDRTRFTTAATGLLNNVLSLTFDWSLALGSIATLNPDYTPALRLIVKDGAQFSELIWEGAYNGTYGNTTKGAWYGSGANDVFHRHITGIPGDTLDGGSQVNLSIKNWADLANSTGSQWYSDAAAVIGISVGVGSSAGSGYHAFADNVSYTTTTGNVTSNFEARAAAAAVPEPASLALVGLALFGAAAARRRSRN